MRINKFIAQATGMSRRKADQAVINGEVLINGRTAFLGDAVNQNDTVELNDKTLEPLELKETITLNKPAGYVCSRDGQGNKTIYDLLPEKYSHLKPVGRLDKDSSGLLLMTNDGKMANELTHPSFGKEKIYEVHLDKPLTPDDKDKIEQGIKIDNYTSRLRLSKNENCELKIVNCSWQVAMSMGRNRQIRRTFGALGYNILGLHRIQFGTYHLHDIQPGHFKIISPKQQQDSDIKRIKQVDS